jgi:hypothetical protein
MLPICDRCQEQLDWVAMELEVAATSEERREWYARFCRDCDVVVCSACAPTEWDEELKQVRSPSCPQCWAEMEMFPTTGWLQLAGRAPLPYVPV